MTTGDFGSFHFVSSFLRDGLAGFLFAPRPIGVSVLRLKSTGICAACCLAILAVLAAVYAYAQEPANGGILKGYVRDSNGRPIASATVFLQLATESPTPAVAPQSTQTGSDGAYRFAALPAGAYTLRAQMNGYSEAIASRVPLARKEMKHIDLVLIHASASESQNASLHGTLGRGTSDPGTSSANPRAAAPEFFDEPQFTVAGVTEAANAGGHGSDSVLRTSEALARATVSLDASPDNGSAGAGNSLPSAATENSLRDAVAHDPKNARLHHQLAEHEEKLGHPLEAVREYQRAAELDPSEPYLFDWGTELLTHRALEPATEVFVSGNRFFPKSARMLIALGVSWYARGAYDQAARCLASASDMEPANPTPYLFLGKIQSAGAASDASAAETAQQKLARFAELQPENALANYYYAVSLWNRSQSAADGESDAQLNSERSERVESLLQKAVHLDPKLSGAYLQLGILYAQRADYQQAIAVYRKAIEVGHDDVSSEHSSPDGAEMLAQTHYRLAQAYQRTGEKTRAQEELQLHEQLVKKTQEDTERERREIQEFVITLRRQDPASPTAP
jgi:tetratricopeptide (TPR) repeat protein